MECKEIDTNFQLLICFVVDFYFQVYSYDYHLITSKNIHFSEASETAMTSFNEENIIISLLEAFHLAESDKELLLIIGKCIIP